MPHRHKIGELDLSYPLAGSEGVDTNHASRIRVQMLLDQHSSLIQQTQYADAKAGALITVIGLLALNGPLPLTDMMTADFVAAAGGAIAALCMLFCVFTVFPRYPGKRIRDRLAETDRFSWPSLATTTFDGDAYSDYMHTAEISEIVHSIALSNSSISLILLRKFQTLRVAFFLGAIFIIIVFARHAGVV